MFRKFSKSCQAVIQKLISPKLLFPYIVPTQVFLQEFLDIFIVLMWLFLNIFRQFMMLMAMVKQSPVPQLLQHRLLMQAFITPPQDTIDLNPKILPINPFILFNLKNPIIGKLMIWFEILLLDGIFQKSADPLNFSKGIYDRLALIKLDIDLVLCSFLMPSK